jgi:hypothetical protein
MGLIFLSQSGGKVWGRGQVGKIDISIGRQSGVPERVLWFLRQGSNRHNDKNDNRGKRNRLQNTVPLLPLINNYLCFSSAPNERPVTVSRFPLIDPGMTILFEAGT